MNDRWVVCVASIVASAVAVTGCGNDSSVSASAGAAACVTATACGIVAGGVSNCTANVLNTNNPLFAGAVHFSTKTVNCIAAAGSNCDNAKKCLNAGQTPASCTNASAACDGTVLDSCQDEGSGNVTTKFDCSDIAEMCVVNGGTADCGFGTCTGAASMCVGTRWQQCQNGVLRQADCADFGANCVVGALANAHCRGNGPTCQSTLIGADAIGNPLRCDGSVLVRCADSQESRYDCASQNEKCVANVNGASFGCALGNSCTPSTFSATCAGSKLTYCDNGVIATFNCSSTGFSGCTPDNGGQCTP